MTLPDPRVFRSDRLLLVRRDDRARLVRPTMMSAAPAMPTGSVAAHAHVATPWIELSRNDPDYRTAINATSDAAGWDLPDFLRDE